jgi:hypothetical protein
VGEFFSNIERKELSSAKPVWGDYFLGLKRNKDTLS